jgi:hypothetical protein
MNILKTLKSCRCVVYPVLVIVVVYVLYYLLTRNRQVEVYKYTVSDLHNNSHATALNQNNTYTNHIHADLYDKNGVKVGYISSINQHTIKNEVNHVNTITTYKTKLGAVSCNYYYETNPTTHYVYGQLKAVGENPTGQYDGKNVQIHLDGKDNGERIVTITSQNKFFFN